MKYQCHSIARMWKQPRNNGFQCRWHFLKDILEVFPRIKKLQCYITVNHVLSKPDRVKVSQSLKTNYFFMPQTSCPNCTPRLSGLGDPRGMSHRERHWFHSIAKDSIPSPSLFLVITSRCYHRHGPRWLWSVVLLHLPPYIVTLEVTGITEWCSTHLSSSTLTSLTADMYLLCCGCLGP